MLASSRFPDRPADRLVIDGKPLSSNSRCPPRSGRPAAAAGSPATLPRPMAEVRTLLADLRGRGPQPARPAQLLRLRTLLASAAAADTPALRAAHDPARLALRMLDEVLDSPLDPDASLLEALGRVLEPSPADEAARLARRMRQMNRLMVRQARQLPQAPPRLPQTRDADRSPSAADAPSPRTPAAPSAPPLDALLRGYHVRQAGHDFLLPIDAIDEAFAADVESLPTVQGRTVVFHSGRPCEVVRLAARLGLAERTSVRPNTLLVVTAGGTRVCLAIDEIVGPLQSPLLPMESILPGVTLLKAVAVLKSGRLALVPDLARLLGPDSFPTDSPCGPVLPLR
ncbi:MAG: chemotaxis protein CheW [Thermoguttaceae bacterium]